LRLARRAAFVGARRRCRSDHGGRHPCRRVPGRSSSSHVTNSRSRDALGHAMALSSGCGATRSACSDVKTPPSWLNRESVLVRRPLGHLGRHAGQAFHEVDAGREAWPFARYHQAPNGSHREATVHPVGPTFATSTDFGHCACQVGPRVRVPMCPLRS
jgi:hypothetical protein